MSLVLAVQPDASQAERLASVCRRIGTDLVLAASAPEALAALGCRIPDVILSAPLLPASDEAAIAERLRALGDDALHVQAISAPVLGDLPVAEPEPKGLLKAFKRPRRAAAPAVCDEVAFAGELSGHLLRAVAERASMAAEPIEADVPEIAPAAAQPPDDLWPHSRVTGYQVQNPATARLRLNDVRQRSADQEPDAGEQVRLNHLPQGYGEQEPDTTGIPDPGSRIPDPDAPLDIELISLVDAIAEECKPRKRKGQARRSRKRRVHDDAAYFDPSRSEFAAVVDKFDEFTRQHSRVA